MRDRENLVSEMRSVEAKLAKLKIASEAAQAKH